MTKAASSNSLEEVSPQSPSCSSSTSSTEVYNSPLGQGGEIFVNDEKFDLATIGSLASPYATASNILVSNNAGVTKIGTIDFHITSEGPTEVKINQVAPAQEPKENGLHKNAPASPQPQPSQTCTKKPSPGLGVIKRNFKAIIILITSVTLVCAVALIALRFIGGGDSNYVIRTTTTEEPITTTKSPLIHHIFRRSDWGARNPSTDPIPIERPVSLVIIKDTKTQTCFDVSSCFTVMQDLQNSDVGIYKLPDIRYNFVIGGDGNIYEGRGWKAQNEQKNDTIDVAFMGDFNVDVPSDFMVDAGPWLVTRGILYKYLDWENPKVVCHNQTEEAEGPGGNLYKRVVQWKYYSNETII